MTYQAKLIKGGKIVIPADLRRELGFEEGDSIIVERDGDRIVLKSRDALVRELQAKVKARMKRPISVQGYLDEKWAESDRE